MKTKKLLMYTFACMVLLPTMLMTVTFCMLGEIMDLQRTELSDRFSLIMLALGFIILLFTSAGITYWLQKHIYTPAIHISNAMAQIADGNLDYKLNVDTDGELGDLNRNYNRMRRRLKQSIEEQQDIEKHNKELISNISHDLKTPITAIKGYMEGLLDGVANTPEKFDRYVRTVINKANDMDNLIDELSFYANINAKRIPYNFQAVNVDDFFRDCVDELSLELNPEYFKLEFTNTLTPDTCIIADPEQLKKVINNIIGNSVKYMDKKRCIIQIWIMDEHDSVCVEISDNGRGIAAGDLPNIFERFYRADESRNSNQGGSGIGLSIVKQIVEDHGGYIWATSHQNQGTVMHFVLRKYLQL